MNKILITGANGFLGSHLVDFCINKDLEIFGLDRPNQSYNNLRHYTNNKIKFTDKEKNEICGNRIQIPTNNNKLKLLECDIKNKELLNKIISELNPKFIFHFGAQPYIQPSWENPVETIETNVIGTINVFEPIKEYKIKTRVILACTAAEYGTTTEINRPLKENDPLLAIHPYGISKIAAELLARQYFLNFGIEIVNLRFFNQTGIRRINDAPSDFIRKVAQIKLGLLEPIIQVGNLDSYRDFTDVKDSINAIWVAATKGRVGETYNICSNRKIQIRDILEIALSFSDKEVTIKEDAPDKLRKMDEDAIIGDNSKIHDELGWEPKISIKKTLKNMFDYWINYYKKEITDTKNDAS